MGKNETELGHNKSEGEQVQESLDKEHSGLEVAAQEANPEELVADLGELQANHKADRETAGNSGELIKNRLEELEEQPPNYEPQVEVGDIVLFKMTMGRSAGRERPAIVVDVNEDTGDFSARAFAHIEDGFEHADPKYTSSEADHDPELKKVGSWRHPKERVEHKKKLKQEAEEVKKKQEVEKAEAKKTESQKSESKNKSENKNKSESNMDWGRL